MAEELPGFIPKVLRLDDVSLLGVDETVFSAMVDGWRAQMLARGLAVNTIKGPSRLVARFVELRGHNLTVKTIAETMRSRAHAGRVANRATHDARFGS